MNTALGRALVLVAAAALVLPGVAEAETTALFPGAWFEAIRGEASGELPLVDFQQIVTRFSGFTPSAGGDAMAEYPAARLRQHGLEQVAIEGYPADGKMFFWAFLGEPAWEAEVGTLTMVEPRVDRLADFSAHRVVLGRYSTSADVRAELVDVGPGTRPEDYAGKDVRGRIALGSGDAQVAHAQAVWRHGAAEAQLDRWVPARNEAIRGPVNLWRPEDGSIWIARKTGLRRR